MIMFLRPRMSSWQGGCLGILLVNCSAHEILDHSAAIGHAEVTFVVGRRNGGVDPTCIMSNFARLTWDLMSFITPTALLEDSIPTHGRYFV